MQTSFHIYDTYIRVSKMQVTQWRKLRLEQNEHWCSRDLTGGLNDHQMLVELICKRKISVQKENTVDLIAVSIT